MYISNLDKIGKKPEIDLIALPSNPDSVLIEPAMLLNVRPLVIKSKEIKTEIPSPRNKKS